MQQISSDLIKSLIKKQNELQEQVKIQPLKHSVKIIAGCDSSLVGQKIFSVFVMFKYPSLEQLEIAYDYSYLELPYIPGLLAFREIPNLLKTFNKVKCMPDLIMVDGHGISHPRGMGIASHLGVLLNIPTIGIAKKPLVGKYRMPKSTKLNSTELLFNDKMIGFALRTKDNIKPVFVSPGHLITHEQALDFAIATTAKFKLPEPVRIADKYSKTLKKVEITDYLN